MKITIVIGIMILMGACVNQKNLSIENNHFNHERIHKTTLSVLKVKHPFAKRETHFRSILWRTDEGRLCETVYTETLQLKSKGIKLTFLYSGFDDKKDRTITEIEFCKKSYFLNNGIIIHQSRLNDVDSLYSDVVTEKTAKYMVKKTDHAYFFADYSNNKDSLESHMIINRIEIR